MKMISNTAEFKSLHCFQKYNAMNICDVTIIVQSKYRVKSWYVWYLQN